MVHRLRRFSREDAESARTANEGQQVSYELKDERGKTAAVDLKAI